MGERWTKEEFLADLETRGENQVRIDLDAGRWGGPQDEKVQLAKRWLLEKEQTRSGEAERRQEALASRTAAATEAQARAAEKAVSTSRWALVVSVVAILISIVTLYLERRGK